MLGRDDLMKLGQTPLLRQLESAAQDTGSMATHDDAVALVQEDDVAQWVFDKDKMIVGGIAPDDAAIIRRLLMQDIQRKMSTEGLYVSAFGTSRSRRRIAGALGPDPGYREATMLGSLIRAWDAPNALQVKEALKAAVPLTAALIADVVQRMGDAFPNGVIAHMATEDPTATLCVVEKVVPAVGIREAVSEILTTCITTLAGFGASVLLCGVRFNGEDGSGTVTMIQYRPSDCNAALAINVDDSQIVRTVTALASLGIFHATLPYHSSPSTYMGKTVVWSNMNRNCIYIPGVTMEWLEFAMLCSVSSELMENSKMRNAPTEAFEFVERRIALLASLPADVALSPRTIDVIGMLNALWYEWLVSMNIQPSPPQGVAVVQGQKTSPTARVQRQMRRK